jgi:hypothetical protein
MEWDSNIGEKREEDKGTKGIRERKKLDGR